METTLVYRGHIGYIGTMENKMETTLVYRGHIWVILGVTWDFSAEAVFPAGLVLARTRYAPQQHLANLHAA